jgi:hypothetical protein
MKQSRMEISQKHLVFVLLLVIEAEYREGGVKVLLLFLPLELEAAVRSHFLCPAYWLTPLVPILAVLLLGFFNHR